MSNQENNRVLPFLWPWNLINKERGSFTELIKSRRFTIIYLVIIWSIVGVLGFATTREWECSTTWEMALYCEYAFWVKNLTEAPLVFFRNLLITPFLHNGLDHILFVSVVGFLIIVQSYEAIFGWKKTALIFLSAYVTVAPFFGMFYNVGIEIFPESEFMQFAFARNWMGGSIGMFQVYGALAIKSKKPFIMLSIPFFFEAFNLFIFGIDLHISLMHLMSTLLGYSIARMLIKKRIHNAPKRN
ncbi:hypothetical protein [Ekhidna sp.]|uniref:hypothetical protein n=1 Tax=Ekhidna sp. TaxID=2608089 RepID=UPI0032973BC2